MKKQMYYTAVEDEVSDIIKNGILPDENGIIRLFDSETIARVVGHERSEIMRADTFSVFAVYVDESNVFEDRLKARTDGAVYAYTKKIPCEYIDLHSSK